jgi:hypothetical protein
MIATDVRAGPGKGAAVVVDSSIVVPRRPAVKPLPRRSARRARP